MFKRRAEMEAGQHDEDQGLTRDEVCEGEGWDCGLHGLQLPDHS